MFRWEAYSRWGASDRFNEPNQTKGQQLYGEPVWLDDNTLLVTDVSSLFGDQVATYTVGGGDSSLTQWFSDPDASVKDLQFAIITRQGDKLAFVASTQVEAAPVTVGTGPETPLAAFGSLWIDNTGQTVGITPSPALPASVARLDPRTRVVTTEPFAGAPSAGFGSLWIRHNNTILRYDPPTDRPIARSMFRT